MEIPGLGPVESDDETYISYPITVPVLDYNEVEFFVEGYDDDDDQEDFHTAIETFLALDESALQDASKAVFAYYRQASADYEPDDDDPTEFPDIGGPDDVWEHVELGVEATVVRETEGDQEVVVSVECTCDWARDKGLVLVFRGGREVSKAGPLES